MSDTLFTDVAPLSKDRHGDWSLKTDGGFGFSRKTSIVPLVVREIPEAAGELPIVFVLDGEAAKLCAVLGLRQQENLYLRDDDRWDGRYVPATLRQYPFVIGRVKDSEHGLLSIDQGYPGFNRAGEGSPLFADDGSPSEIVTKAREFSANLAKSAAQTQRFCATLAELNLLTPLGISLKAAGGEQHQIRGLSAVNRERLGSLAESDVKKLLDQNALELIFLHLYSLRHLRSLAARMAPGDKPDTLPEADPPGLD